MDKKATILIVDDEPYNVDYLEQELEDLGYDTISAFNGQEALEQVAAESPDIILLDITMPVMNGFEALTHLKADKGTRDIPVIVISAMDDMDSVVRGIELGAEDYLPKPFDPVLLQARIRSGLERKWLRDQEQLYLQGLERELEIGRHIQAEFLPSELPQPEGWEIAAFFEAARQVSGDFYDAFTLASDGKIGLLVGDVSDKGVGAALYMTLFRTLLRVAASREEFGIWQNAETTATGNAAIDRGHTLKNAITVTNSYVVENHGQSSMFATIFFGVLDPATGSLLYVNGGHEPPVILNAGEVIEDLPRTGPVVGILPDTSFTVGEAQLEPGDTLLMFTDGITEAQDARGELFGRERLLELLRQPGKGSIPLPDRIAAAVLEYIGDAKQFDDITIVAVRRK